jgi:8-oxo-dGTP pyrophosphatase MutT (NUDIX family)
LVLDPQMTLEQSDLLQVVARLRNNLSVELPGLRGHSALAPRPRRPLLPAKNQLRQAAGLLLLYPIENIAHTLLTVRAGSLPQHGGQVSLPGGAIEENETFAQAALRETREEIGVPTTDVHILGPLSPLQIPVSGFLLHPIVGAIYRRPRFRLSRREVDRVIEVPLTTLTNQKNLRRRWQERDSIDIDVPYFELDGTQVWGATAMILSELLFTLGYELNPWQ